MIGSSIQEQNERFWLIEVIGEKKLSLLQNTIMLNTTCVF